MTLPAAPHLSSLDVYDIAHLVGGPSLVADAAVVALVQGGHVRVDPAGQLSAVGPRRRHPVEAAVLDAIGTRPRHSLPTVRRRLAGDRRVTDIGERLTVHGLLGGRPRLFPGRDPVPTREGRRAVKALRADPPQDRVAGGTSALRVALSGISALDDTALRAQLFPPQHRSRQTSSRRRGADSSSWHVGGWSGSAGDGGWGGSGGGDCGGGGDGGGGGC
jgi:uncharacterized membrane protein YgcG